MKDNQIKNAFWGIFLITIGVFLVLHKMGILDFKWYKVWQLWPMIFIFWGISLIPLNKWANLLLKLLLLAFCLYYLSSPHMMHDFGRHDLPWV